MADWRPVDSNILCGACTSVLFMDARSGHEISDSFSTAWLCGKPQAPAKHATANLFKTVDIAAAWFTGMGHAFSRFKLCRPYQLKNVTARSVFSGLNPHAQPTPASVCLKSQKLQALLLPLPILPLPEAALENEETHIV